MENKCEAVLKCERFSKRKAVLFLLLILTIPLLANKSVSAQVSIDLSVTATVLPARYIIVNKNNVVTKVISNTNEDVLPVVCLNDCHQKIVGLTPSITKQYQKITTVNNNKMIGVITTSPLTHNNELKNKEHFAFGGLIKSVAIGLLGLNPLVNLPAIDVPLTSARVVSSVG